MPKAKVFFLFEIFFIIGVLGASIFYSLGIGAGTYFLPLAALLFLALFAFLRLERRRNLSLVLVLSSFALGCFYLLFYVSLKSNSDYFLRASNLGRKNIETEVQIISSPLKLNSRQKFFVKPLGRYGKAVVSASSGYELDYGDQVFLEGRIRPIKDKYYFKDNVFTEVRASQVKVARKGRGNKVISALYKLEKSLEGRISRVFGEREASFYNGILFGDRKSMSKDFKDALKRSGTMHLVALSGYNISIISVYFLDFLIFLGLSRGIAFWPAVVGIFLFVLMTGASSSCLRAAIMGSLYLVSQKVGRISEPKYLLAFAAFLMVLLNPKIAFFDIGFQLSFLATIGLFYLYPALESLLLGFTRKKVKNLSFSFKKIPFFGDFLITISAQLMVLPLIIVYFGYLPLAGVFANTLILPVIPVLMASSFFIALISYLSYHLAVLVSYFLKPIWIYLKQIIYFASRFVFLPGRFFLLFFMLAYLFGLFLLFYGSRRENQ